MKRRLLKLTVLLFVVSFVYANEAPKFDKVNTFHVCPIEQNFNLEVSATDDSGVATLSCNLSSFPGATFVDHGNGIGELSWTPASGDEGFAPELKIIANDGVLSTTKTFVLWVSLAGVPVVDIKGTTWSGHGDDFETSDMAWTLYGVSADGINHLTETTWENRTSGINGQAAGEVPFWQLSAYELGLVEGDNLIVAAAHNDAGDVSYNGINIVYDISPPLVTITNPVSTIVITNSSELIVSGITEEEQTEITGVSWLTTPSLTSGIMLDLYSWSVDGELIGLTEGTNVVKVSATNSVGLTGTDSVIIILDSTPPEIVITNPANGNDFLIGYDDFVLSGYAFDPDTALENVIWENVTAGENGEASGVDSWQIDGSELGLVQGSNLIVVTIENDFGITDQDSVYIIYDDFTPPIIVIDYPSDILYFTETTLFPINGIAYDLESNLNPISWMCDPGGLSGQASGIATWSENANNIGLVPGTNVFMAIAENIFGLSSTATCTIIFEENLPFLEITEPNGGENFTVGITNFLLEGIAGDIDTPLVDVNWSNELTGVSGVATGIANWSATGASLGLDFGANRIVVRTENIYGYAAEDSVVITWDDTTPPVLEILSPNSGNYFLTNATDLIFTGIVNDVESGVASLMWEILPGGSGGDITTSGDWLIPAGFTIQTGTNILTVIATNGIGLVTNDEQIFVYDPTLPEIVITNPAGGNDFIIGNTDFILSGWANDVDTPLISVSWENETANTSGTTIGKEDWQVAGLELGLVNGSNLIVVTAENIYGMTAQDSVYIIYNDLTPPILSIEFPSNVIYFTETDAFSINGTVYDLESELKPLRWRAAPSGYSGNANGKDSWFLNVAESGLLPGSNVFTITAENEFGLLTTAVCSIIYEIHKPVLLITGPNDGENFITETTNFTLIGTASDIDTELVDVTWSNLFTGRTGIANGIANWSAEAEELGLVFGANTIVVKTRNIFGYPAEDTIVITWEDTTAPELEIQSPNNGDYFYTNSADLVFDGIAKDEQSGIQSLYWELSPSGSKDDMTGSENWSLGVSIADVVTGSNVLTVTASNGVGLVTTDQQVFVYDATPPVVVITNPVATEIYSAGNSDFILSGYAFDHDSTLVQISWENKTAGTNGLAVGLESWSIDANSINLQQGSNLVTVTAKVDNGGSSEDNIIIIYDDATPPEIFITSPTNIPYVATDNVFSILGLAEDAESEIDEITWTCSPGGVSGVASGLNSWSANAGQIGLQPGTNCFEATAKNEFGLTASASIDIIYELNQPYVVITAPNNGNDFYTGNTNFMMDGFANDVDTDLVRVIWSNATTKVGGVVNGIKNWSIHATALGLIQGRNDIIVMAENIYGFYGVDDRIAIYVQDNTDPYIFIESPNNGETYVTVDKEMEISGRAEDNESGITTVEWTISPGGESGTATGTIAWTIPEGAFVVTEGSNIITVTAHNGLGGIGEDSQVLIIDTGVPVIEILTPTTLEVYAVGGIEFDLGGSISIGSSLLSEIGWVNHTSVAEGIISDVSNSTWSVMAEKLSLVRGTNIIEVYAINGMGIRGSDSITLIINDQEAPTIEIITPANGDFITESPVQIGGIASDDVGIYRIDVNGVNAVGSEGWYASITLNPGINKIKATAFDLPPSQSAEDSIMLLYGDKDKEKIDVKITGPSKEYYWETTGSNVSLAGTASGVFGVQKVIWINKSMQNKYGYTDGQSIWTAADLPLKEGSNEIMIVAYDMNDNWGKDTIIVYSSDTSTANVSPVIFEKVKINRNKKVSYSVFLRDMLIIGGKISETAFNNFDVSNKENPDILSILMKGKTTTGKVLIRNWNSNERIEQVTWNKVLWKETDKKNVKIKKSVGAIQIGPVKEGRMKAKFKWKKGKKDKPSETTFIIKIDRQKLLGNQTDNIDSIDLSEPVEFWLGIGNTQVRGTVIFDEETFKAKQINQ